MGPPRNQSFYVFVGGFKGGKSARPWFYVKISFQQSTMSFSLVNLFVIFFSCFLSLLLVGGVFWKIKQRYDNYRRRQRAYVEMEQMASRPFAVVCPDLDPGQDWPGHKDPATGLGSPRGPHGPNRLPRPKEPSPVGVPSPIALEPCQDAKAAVLSLLIVLPRGDEDATPPGTMGLTIGSTLVHLGSTRKGSEAKLHREGWNGRKGGGQGQGKEASHACRNTSHHPPLPQIQQQQQQQQQHAAQPQQPAQQLPPVHVAPIANHGEDQRWVALGC